MLARVALLLDAVNLRNLCLLYFFVSPFLLDRKDPVVLAILFVLGYLFCGAILALALAERLTRFSDRFRYHALSLPVFAIVVVMLLTSVFANPTALVSFGPLFAKYGKVVFPALTFLVMINVLRARDLPVLFSLLVGVGVLSLVVSVFDVQNWMARPKDPLPRVGEVMFGDPNKYAVFLNILYAALFAQFLARWKTGRPVARVTFAIGVVVFMLFLTQSRSGILAFVLMTALCLWASASRELVRRAVILMLPAIVLLGVAFLLRYTGELNAVDSDLGRIWTYTVAWNVIQHHPLAGLGFGNTMEMYERYGQLQLSLIGFPLDIHNTILEVFAQQGIAGVVAYLAFVFIPVILLLRRIREKMHREYPVAEVAALAVPLCFFTYGLFYHQYITNEHFWAYMAITYLVLRARDGEPVAMHARFPRLV